MTILDDIRLPARGNIRRFLTARDTAGLMLVMAGIDGWRVINIQQCAQRLAEAHNATLNKSEA